jgi:hypothetical protein
MLEFGDTGSVSIGVFQMLSAGRTGHDPTLALPVGQKGHTSSEHESLVWHGGEIRDDADVRDIGVRVRED